MQASSADAYKYLQLQTDLRRTYPNVRMRQRHQIVYYPDIVAKLKTYITRR